MMDEAKEQEAKERKAYEEPRDTVDDKVKIRFYGNVASHTGVQEVSEAELPDTRGLERHFGFKEFKHCMKEGALQPDSEIIIFTGFVSRNLSRSYMRESYIVVDETLLYKGNMEGNPRKELKGIHWYSVK
jgi:hypothetical protein